MVNGPVMSESMTADPTTKLVLYTRFSFPLTFSLILVIIDFMFSIIV